MRNFFKLAPLIVSLSVQMLPAPAQTQENALAQARARYESGDYKKTEKECALFLESHPKDEEALILMGKALLASGEFEHALEILRKCPFKDGALELAMKNEDSLNINDDIDEGYPSWLQALVLHYVAEIQADRGQFDRALRLCEKAASKTGIFPESLLLRINILLSLTRLYEAEEVCRQYITQRPEDFHSWLAFGLVLEKQRKLQQSLAAFRLAQSFIEKPPYRETNLAQRRELIQSKIEYLVARTGTKI